MDPNPSSECPKDISMFSNHTTNRILGIVSYIRYICAAQDKVESDASEAEQMTRVTCLAGADTQRESLRRFRGFVFKLGH